MDKEIFYNLNFHKDEFKFFGIFTSQKNLMETPKNPEKLKEFPFLKKLEEKIEMGKRPDAPENKIKRYYQKGSSQIAKKMGEESVEMVIASEQGSDENFLEEAADVFFYYLMSLHARGFTLRDVLKILKRRHNKNKKQS
ncbi:phosphoribosyl-ATP diphosphatase [Moheibacter stercoris]|uniref:phosphoribosyl-ATP diphosphatase n=1 Tax=Moheibacter stercoris TaxID=1628251 RepID=A0ABV2LRP2_9FLAO